MQLPWRVDFPEVTRFGPWGVHLNSRGIPSFLPQLEKNQEILPSTQDEAFFQCCIWREIPPSLLSLERVRETLEATHEVHRHTLSNREEPKGICHKSGIAPFFLPHLEMRVPVPASSGKESRQTLRISRRGGFNLKVERKYRDHTTIPKGPDVPFHARYT